MDRAARVGRAAPRTRTWPKIAAIVNSFHHGAPWHTLAHQPTSHGRGELHRKCQQTHARNSAVQCISVHFIAVQCSAVQCSVVQCSAVLKCNVKSARHSTRQHCKSIMHSCKGRRQKNATPVKECQSTLSCKDGRKTERLVHICKANTEQNG